MFLSSRAHLGLIALFAIFSLSAPAATIGPLPGAGFVIPDGNPAGASSIINNPTAGTITDVTVAIDFGSIADGITGHTWIADLTATLSFGGFSVDLFSGIGVTPASGFGDGSNLLGLYSFNDSFLASLTAAAAAALDDATVPNGDYFPTTANDAGTSLVGSFGGLDAAGAWTLRIVDAVSGDDGGIAGWSLTLITQDPPPPPGGDDGDPGTPPAAVPEPGSMGLLALGLFALAASARRRAS